jgi:uncharacterized membrane protein
VFSWSAAGLGVVAAVVGTVVVLDAEQKLSTATTHDKDGALLQDTIGVVVAGAGIVLTGAGVAVALMGGP